MATLYVTEEYAVLKKYQKRLVIEKDNNVLLEIPLFKIDSIILFGKIQVTADAIQYLLENKVSVSFFNQYGRLKGKLVDASSKNIYLRIAQYENYSDENRRLSLSKNIVYGKIRNIISFFQRYQRNHPEINFDLQISSLKKCLTLLETKKSVASVLGIEGVASSIYFKEFSKMILNDDWKGTFFCRTQHPPKDPINSLLSLGYSLVTNELWSLLDGLGFDPFVGFLHEIDYGRPSLAIDLLEEFRIPVVDRVIIELINHKVIEKNDFECIENGYRMKKDSLKKFFKHFDRRITSVFKNPDNNQETNYRKMFFYQAQKLAKSILTKTDYTPFNYL